MTAAASACPTGKGRLSLVPCPLGMQQVNELGPSSVQRLREDRLAIRGLDRVDIRARVDEHCRGFERAAVNGTHEWSPSDKTVRLSRIDVRTFAQQKLDHFDVASKGGAM